MPTNERFTFKVYEGPSLVAPFAAIVAEFESPSPKLLSSREILQQLKELYPFSSQLDLVLADDDTEFASLVVALMTAFQEHPRLGAEPVFAVHSNNGHRHRIAVRFGDLEVARNTLMIGIEIADVLFARAAGRDVDIQESSRKIRETLSEITRLPHSKITAALSRLASARGIPTYPVSRRTGIYMFGQGANASHFQEMASSRDSLMGWKLAKHKPVTGQLLRRLGFPTAEQKVTANAATARRIARELGYPLVVKPTDGSRGTAVAVGITTDEELEVAFERARAASTTKQALLERYVTGNNHRLSVVSGKLVRVHRQLLPQIIGDGKQSVAELIEGENLRRRDDPDARVYCPQLIIDGDMTALLRKQGFMLEDRPPQAHVLKLRSTSNLHTGGTPEVVTAYTHPDNIDMVETIAKNFHLDAIGIDFITPDISKAWHEIECAIIEVNCNPGINADPVMENILLERFPAGSDGRIPSFLIVGDSGEILDSVVKYVSASGRRVGHTDGTRTELAGQPRFRGTVDLPARILGLLLDTTCEALAVDCTPDEIVEYGLPHTRYDLALIARPGLLPEEIRQLVEDNSTQIIEGVTMDGLGEVVYPSITKILNKS